MGRDHPPALQAGGLDANRLAAAPPHLLFGRLDQRPADSPPTRLGHHDPPNRHRSTLRSSGSSRSRCSLRRARGLAGRRVNLRRRPAPRNSGFVSDGAYAPSSSSIAQEISSGRKTSPSEMIAMSRSQSDGKRGSCPHWGVFAGRGSEDAPDQVIITETGGASGSGESAGGIRQIAVRIHVNHVRGPIRRHPQIQATVVAKLHGGECGARDTLNLLQYAGRQAGAGHRLGAAKLGRGLGPLALEERMRGGSDRHLGEVDLGQRQHVNVAVGLPQHRGVDLAAFDVAFHQRGLTIVRSPRRPVLQAPRDRGPRNPEVMTDRRILSRGLDNQRERQRHGRASRDATSTASGVGNPRRAGSPWPVLVQRQARAQRR